MIKKEKKELSYRAREQKRERWGEERMNMQKENEDN